MDDDADHPSVSSDGMPGEAPAEVAYDVDVEVAVPGTSEQLLKTVKVLGSGTKPPQGAKVFVHYVGTLASDGSQFDSSRDRGERFEFTLGTGAVIKGWDIGVATMHKGETAVLRCLPEYGYGAQGSPPKIPGGATLNFEVELLDWAKSEDVSERKDGTLVKSVRVVGSGYDHAEYEATVVADVAVVCRDGDADGDVLWRQDGWNIVVGDTLLPVGLEEALKSFKKGEQSAVDVAAALVVEDDTEHGISRGSDVRYVVTVHSIACVKTWEFKGMDKVTEGERRKEQGNAWLKQMQPHRALAKYKRALEFTQHDYGLNDEEKARAKSVTIAAFNNMALIHSSLGDAASCIEQCDKCLECDGQNAKALYRRGKALGMRGDWSDGKRDLTRVLELQPGNADALRELAALEAQQKAYDRKQKALFSNMFERMAKMEASEKPEPVEAVSVPVETTPGDVGPDAEATEVSDGEGSEEEA